MKASPTSTKRAMRMIESAAIATAISAALSASHHPIAALIAAAIGAAMLITIVAWLLRLEENR